MTKRKYYYAGFVDGEMDSRPDQQYPSIKTPALFEHKWRAKCIYADVRRVQIVVAPPKSEELKEKDDAP